MLSKIDKIKAFQQALGSYPDGIPGESTWDAAYRFLDAEGYLTINFPYAVKQWGCYVVFGDGNELKAIDAEGKTSVRNWANSMSGSFTHPSGVHPCSILVDNGVANHNYACHHWQGYPETVLYWHTDGFYGMELCKTADELPEGIKWAVGGGRIIRKGKKAFSFEQEGFVGAYADVKRKAAHNAIGFDQYGNVMGVYHRRCTLEDFQRRCLNIGMYDGIFLDGGSVSAFNVDGLKANVNQRQGFILQF